MCRSHPSYARAEVEANTSPNRLCRVRVLLLAGPDLPQVELRQRSDQHKSPTIPDRNLLQAPCLQGCTRLRGRIALAGC